MTLKAPREQLGEAIATGGFTLFLGAGASMAAGLPGWKAALLELADALEPRARARAETMREDANAERFLEAAELLYLANITIEERIQCLRTVFDKPTTITKRLRILARAPYRSVVTTNFDRSFLAAASQASVDLIQYSETEDDLANARTSRERYLLRLHGRIEAPNSLVLARSHYQALSQKPEYANFVESLLADSTVVFFGFSFADPHFLATLRNFSEVTRGRMRHTAYALLADQPHQSVKEVLDRLNVLVVPYSSANDHAEAWEFFNAVAGAPTPPPENPSEKRLRRILAATLTHLRSRRSDDLTSSVFAAAVLAELEHQELGVSTDVLVEEVRKQLGIPIASERLVREALAELTRQGRVTRTENAYALAPALPLPGEEATSTLQALVSSVVARGQARYGFHGSEGFDYAGPLQEVLLRVFVGDGLALAHSLVSYRSERIAEQQLKDLVDQAVAALPLRERRRVELLRSAILSLLDRPDKEEEALLDHLASTAFTLCLTLVDPSLNELAIATSKSTAFLDASIVLPWLSVGHPTQMVSDAIINHVGRASVPEFYVNEIVSHRELAIRELTEAKLEDTARFRSYAMYHGLQNINAFLAGYSSRLTSGSKTSTASFAEYLEEVAPFQNENQAGQYLEKRGLAVTTPRLDRADASYFKTTIKERLALLGRNRHEVRIQHDADMLAVLVSPAEASSTFVSADRIVMAALASSTHAPHLRQFLLPYQAAALADLRAGGKRAVRGLSRTVFAVPRDLLEHLREFYTDRVLDDYEPALMQDLPAIVDDIVSEAERQRRQLGSLVAPDVEGYLERSRQFAAIDQFEARFHENMIKARRRRGL